MVLIIDDLLLGIPAKIGSITFQSIYQTAFKLTWIEYQKKLVNTLIVAKHNLSIQKITDIEYKVIESYIFADLNVVKHVLDKI